MATKSGAERLAALHENRRGQNLGQSKKQSVVIQFEHEGEKYRGDKLGK